MQGTKYDTKSKALQRGQELIGVRLGDIDTTGRLNTNKGAIGICIEENWFDYHANSEDKPDLPEAGVEIKATPYKINKDKTISAKERLVCNMIPYHEDCMKTFITSSFWHKNQCMLILSYQHIENISKKEFKVDHAILYSFPQEDRILIEQDWNIIIDKIRRGDAHLLTEADTMYLAACTKGKNKDDLTTQPFNTILAKRRAYSLKTGYMTYLLRTYVFGSKQDEHIVKDYRDIQNVTFIDYINNKVQIYIGKSVTELCEIFGVDKKSKNLNSILFSRMLGLRGTINQAQEIVTANITVKTIRLNSKRHVVESMSFPTFIFKEILQQQWEESSFYRALNTSKFLFVIFAQKEDDYVFTKIKLWNMPYKDIEIAKQVWQKTKETIHDGVKTYVDSKGYIHNNLPKKEENEIAHVRPHAKNREDTDDLPDGRKLTKQCFWLNNSYIEKIIE